VALRRPGTSAASGGRAVARNGLPCRPHANNDAFGVFVLCVVGLGRRVQEEPAVPHARLGYIHLLTSLVVTQKQSSSRSRYGKQKISAAA
jgi:hypothetical protein